MVVIAGETLGRRLRKARLARDLSIEDLARRVNISFSSIAKYERDEQQPPLDRLQVIAEALGVSVAYLLGETDEPRRPEDILAEQAMPVVPVPILGVIHAGDPIPAEEHIIGWTAIPAEEARRGRYFALRVQGDCFDAGPRAIRDGDVVIVRQQPDCQNGEIAVVLWTDVQEAQLRRVYRRGGTVVLRADNPAYPPEVVRSRELTILGVVVSIVSPPAPAREAPGPF